MENVFIHSTAEVAEDARIGAGTRIWNQAQVLAGACIGTECILGKDVAIDFGVVIGNRVKIQYGVIIGHGTTIEDGVFIGPNVCLCNDLSPRAITVTGMLKGQDDWEVGPILVRYGASIGAGSMIMPNVTIGSFALIGAGSVVTRSVPDFALVYGNPARVHGYVCRCGRTLTDIVRTSLVITGQCRFCQEEVEIVGRDTPVYADKP